MSYRTLSLLLFFWLTANYKCKKKKSERSFSFESFVSCSCLVYAWLLFRWSSQCQATVWSTQRMRSAPGIRKDWDRTDSAHVDSESPHLNSTSRVAIAPYCLTLVMSPITYTLMRTHRTRGCPHLRAELPWLWLLTWMRPVMRQSVSEKSWSVTRSSS